MTVDEEVELNDLLTANNVLMILQSRARKALASQTAA